MKTILRSISSQYRDLQYKANIILLYTEYSIFRTQAKVDYLIQLDPVLFTGNYTYAYWRTRGIYKIEIYIGSEIVTLPGSKTNQVLFIDKSSEKILFRFFGVKETVSKELVVKAATLQVKTPVITTDLFSQPAQLHSSFFTERFCNEFTESLEINQVIADVKIQSTTLKLENMDAKVINTDIKIANMDFSVELPGYTSHTNN